MNAMSFLGGEERSAPLDLTGLSPEEIRGVSAGRVSRDQLMNQMVNLLAGQRGREATIAAQEATARLSDVRARRLEESTEMTTITDVEGKSYQIPKEDIVSGLNYLNQAKRNKELNLLTSTQIKSLENTVPITIGKETFKVSPAHYSAIAKAGRERKEAETRTEALKKYEGQKLENLSDMDLADFAVLGGTGGVAALTNRVVLAGETMGLSDAHYRHYAKMYADYSTHVIKMGGPDALIETINGMGRKLGHNHMLLNIPSPSLWGAVGYFGGKKTVSVNLPSNVTVDMVYEEAERQGVPASEILQNIYDRTQESE